KGTAELLAAKGVKVVLSARSKEVGEQIASDIRANAGRRRECRHASQWREHKLGFLVYRPTKFS
ncbi:MAG: hypothetical protein ACJ741_17015, partial [Pyrinomonadaceae bacterium]